MWHLNLVLNFVASPSAILLLLLGILLYWRNKERIEFRKSCGLPGPTPIPIFGNLLQMKEEYFRCDSQWLRQYGDVCCWYFGPKMQIVVSDLDIIRDVMTKNFSLFPNRWFIDVIPSPLNKAVSFVRDKDWKRIRTIVQPSFNARRVKSMSYKISQCAASLANYLSERAVTKETIDIHEISGSYALSTIAFCAFGYDVDAISDPQDTMIIKCRQFFTRTNTMKILLLAALFPETEKLFKKLDLSPFPKDSIDYIVNTMRDVIKQRRSEGYTESDILQNIMDAEILDEHKSEQDDYKGLSYDEVNGQTLALYVGGYETNASLLQFLMYVCAIYPDVQRKLLEEIHEELGDAEPNFQNTKALVYMDTVILETLRMFPPAGRINRVAASTVRMKNITIPKDAVVVIPIYDIQHNSKFHPEPEEFRPERFSKDNKVAMDPTTFLAFGLGPRRCIGRDFTTVSIKTAMTHTLRRVQFVKCDETEMPPLKFKRDTPLLHPISNLKLKVIPRESSC